jgi:hypothetical protein
LLGNKDEQDAIREKHADVKHCPMLRANPNACTGCANNPNEKEDPADPELQSLLPLIEEGFRLHDLAELGLLEKPSLLEIHILRLMHQDIVIERMKVQAHCIALRVAEVFNGK